MPASRIVVEALYRESVAQQRVEIVERKGLGHPDTICDALVEAIAVALNRMYLERLGGIPHYNIDKALLVAGQCSKGFGRGALERPIEFIVGDRATLAVAGDHLPVEDVGREAVKTWVARNLPHLHADRDLCTRFVIAPGSEELRGIYAPGRARVVANDTCAASGGAYLTITGTSAEDADSGQVGRGNRANGLISVLRPTAGEAVAGKNPVAHTGKIYSAISFRLAQHVHARCPGLKEAYAHLMARIGDPVDEPWVGVQLVMPAGTDIADLEGVIRETVEAELAALDRFRGDLSEGRMRVC